MSWHYLHLSVCMRLFGAACYSTGLQNIKELWLSEMMCHVLFIVVVLWLVGDDGGLFWACSPSAPVSGTGTGSLIPLPSRRPLQNLPSFPRRRESTGWMCGARHRHCGLDPQSRGVVTRHAEYLLDTTVAQARTGFKAVSTGWGDNKTTPTILPLSIDGRGLRPVPVPDTGSRG